MWALVGRIRRHATSGNVPPCCLMRCAYQAYKICSVRRRPDKAARRIRQFSLCTDAKKPIRQDGLLHSFDAWQFPTLAWGDPTLPSALRRFTSEFGMGSGGTTALKPPGKSWCTKRIFCTAAALAALVKSVTYFSMLLRIARLPPCLSAKSFGLQSAGHNCIRLTS